MRIALGLRNSTPNNLVLAEAKEPVLRFRLQLLSNKYLLNIFGTSWHPLLSSLPLLIRSLNANFHYEFLFDLPLVKAYRSLLPIKDKIANFPFPPVFQIPPSSPFPTACIDTSTGRSLQSAVNPDMEFLDIFGPLYGDSTIFFTDGSKTKEPNPVGLSIYSPTLSLNLKFKISKEASVYTAEALAILITLKFIKSHRITNSLIFSDSLSTLMAAASPMLSSNLSPIIIDIRNILTKLSNLHLTTRLVWIPGHRGISGNEIADSLARSAITEGTPYDLLLQASEFFTIEKSKYTAASNRLLLGASERTGSIYFKIFFNPSPIAWFSNIEKIDRKRIVTFSRMRSNHYNLAASLFRKNMNSSPACACGFESEDLNHFFWACPLLESFRPQLTRALRRRRIFPPYNIESLIANPTIRIISAIMSFIKQCKVNF